MLKKYHKNLYDLPESIRSGLIGMRVIDVMKVFKENLNIDVPAKQLYEEKSDIFLRLVKGKLEPMPGLRESLDLFKKNHLKLAIASSAVMEYIHIVLSKFSLKEYFDVIVSGNDVSKGKPDPETYQVACKKLSIKPHEAVVLEDAEKGIASAKGAGCFCIAVRNPHTLPQDTSRADVTVDSLYDISLKTLDLINI